MAELTPPGGKIRMTKAQVRKYQREMEEKRRKAQEKLAEYEKSDEFKKEQKEVEKLEEIIDELPIEEL